MSLIPFEEMPGDARLWVFGTDRVPGPDEARRLGSRTRSFLESWTAHDRALDAAFQIREDRFVLVAVDERRARASGCSIDALTRHFRGMEEELGISILDSAPVWYRDEEGAPVRASRTAFREAAARGEVTLDTPVLDLTADTVGDIRTGRWERPARRSWHARLLDSSRETVPPGA